MFRLVLTFVVVTQLLGMPQVPEPVPEKPQVPEPVPEKKPATGGLPAGGLLKGEGGAMHAWYCSQPGNEAALPCLVQQLRGLPKGAERDALQAKIREAPKGNWGRRAEGKGGGAEGELALGPKGRDVVSTMHEGWCALKENAESALCFKWRESAQRRHAAAEEKRLHPAHHKSEYVDMHAAFCDENPKNAETVPCITHRLKSTAPSSAERDRLMEQLKAASPAERMSQREDMLRFWCEDGATKDSAVAGTLASHRADSGVCLVWQKKSQLNGLHAQADLNPLKLPSGKAADLRMPEPLDGKLRPKPEWNLQRGEIEKMHEWYCTSLDGTHDMLLCARWRLRLKGAVEAYDALAREKDQKAVKDMAQVQGVRMRELQQQLHAAKETAAAEETARLEAALKQARRESQEEFFEMHRVWCTEGKGKDDADSLACKKWREWMGKTEL